MRENQLIDGESVITFSDNNLVTLTTHRVRYNNKVWGQSNYISIMLEKVSSLNVVYISYPILLVIGGIAIFIGGVAAYNMHYNQGPGVVAVVGGICIMLVYLGTRRHICVIASDGGGKITFSTAGMNTESLISFMDKIEIAKNNRILKIK